MQNDAWVKILRHIPAAEQGKLMLVTTSGTEIAVQCFLRIDPECLAFKGRLAGSTDGGRVFFIPYARIDYFGYQQPVKESDFQELFGNLEMPSAEPSEAESSPALPAAPTPRQTPVIKSAVLEKFRARSVSSVGTTMRPPADE
jgi:hypothetical protein